MANISYRIHQIQEKYFWEAQIIPRKLKESFREVWSFKSSNKASGKAHTKLPGKLKESLRKSSNKVSEKAHQKLLEKLKESFQKSLQKITEQANKNPPVRFDLALIAPGKYPKVFSKKLFPVCQKKNGSCWLKLIQIPNSFPMELFLF